MNVPSIYPPGTEYVEIFASRYVSEEKATLRKPLTVLSFICGNEMSSTDAELEKKMVAS